MSLYETVLPPNVTMTEVSLDDVVDGYEHNFTLHYNISCDDKSVPVTRTTFAFGENWICIYISIK